MLVDTGNERAPSLAETIRNAMESHLFYLHTAIPGRIVSFDEKTQRADIKPLIKRAFPTEEEERGIESVPVIPGVPVVFPGAGGYRVTFPIRAGDNGDFCYLVFSESSLDKWLAGKGEEVDPEIDHRHSISDAVAFVGLKPFGAPLASIPTDHATIGKDGGLQIHLRDSLINLGDEASNDFVALAQMVRDELNRLQTVLEGLFGVLAPPINEPGNGAPSAMQIAFKSALSAAHIVSGGGGITWPGSVAAAQVKAK